MDEYNPVPKGIWYEEKRTRWRVKLVANKELIHRSYHRDYEDALRAWQEAKKKIVRPSPASLMANASPINKFLCQPCVTGLAE